MKLINECAHVAQGTVATTVVHLTGLDDVCCEACFVTNYRDNEACTCAWESEAVTPHTRFDAPDLITEAATLCDRLWMAMTDVTEMTERRIDRILKRAEARLQQRECAELRAQVERLSGELESAQTAAARARNEIESNRAVIEDAMKRYTYIFDGWRKAQNNEDIADVVRTAMFDWEETRARLYEATR